MNRKIAAAVLTSVLSGGLALGAASAAQAAPASSFGPAASQAVSQAAQRASLAPVTINQVLPDGSTLAGTFTVTQFVAQNGQLVAEGVLNGTLTSVTGAVTQLTDVAGSSVVSSPNAGDSCNVLSLVLGPLHLDVLGLVVDLNQVNLDITAQPGNGNLLGNLLCTVSGLLDQGNGLSGVVNILNNLLGL